MTNPEERPERGKSNSSTALSNLSTGVRAARPPARWAVICAYAVPILMAPSAVWRLPFAFGFDMGMVDPHAPPWAWWALPYTVALLLLIEGLSFLTVGLVRPWGERPPRWVPFVGGRSMKPWVVAIVAGLGGAGLTLLWGSQGVGDLLGHGVEYSALGWEIAATACFIPHVLWGPLLMAVTADYWRRHRGAIIPCPLPIAREGSS